MLKQKVLNLKAEAPSCTIFRGWGALLPPSLAWVPTTPRTDRNAAGDVPGRQRSVPRNARRERRNRDALQRRVTHTEDCAFVKRRYPARTHPDALQLICGCLSLSEALSRDADFTFHRVEGCVQFARTTRASLVTFVSAELSQVRLPEFGKRCSVKVCCLSWVVIHDWWFTLEAAGVAALLLKVDGHVPTLRDVTHRYTLHAAE